MLELPLWVIIQAARDGYELGQQVLREQRKRGKVVSVSFTHNGPKKHFKGQKVNQDGKEKEKPVDPLRVEMWCRLLHYIKLPLILIGLHGAIAVHVPEGLATMSINR